jgi:hypothetical protein
MVPPVDYNSSFGQLPKFNPHHFHIVQGISAKGAGQAVKPLASASCSI